MTDTLILARAIAGAGGFAAATSERFLVFREMVIENRFALSIRASRLIAAKCEDGSEAVG